MTRRPMVSVIGDASLEKDSEKYKLAKKLGYTLVSEGYRIVTGGLGGVMEAVSIGARSSPKYKEGDIIGITPSYNPDDSNGFVDICIATGLDLSRNIIIANSDAVIAIGGGAGTMSEIAHAWALNRLIIAYKVEGWSGLVADKKIDNRIRYPQMPEDRVFGVTSETEVLKILKLLNQYTKRHNGIKKRVSSI